MKKIQMACAAMVLMGSLCAFPMAEAATPEVTPSRTFDQMMDGSFINWGSKAKVGEVALNDKNGKPISFKETFRVEIMRPLTKEQAKIIADKAGKKEIRKAEFMLCPTLVLIGKDNVAAAIPMGSIFYKRDSNGDLKQIGEFYPMKELQASLPLSNAVTQYYAEHKTKGE